MNMPKRTSVDGKIMDVVTPDEYEQNLELYGNQSTAIEMTCPDGQTYILPNRRPTDDRAGIYQAGLVYFIRDPKSEEEKSMYLKENLTIIDYNDISNVTDFINKQEQLRNIESEILTDIDNVYTPQIDYELDSAEMQALKKAVEMKHCDVDKYAERFGPNFLNDKRILRGHSITLNKIIRICSKMDMEVELRIRDAHSDVPNPMGGEVVAKVTSGGSADE